ncbi:hypothetical protein TEA_017838 [Camellia sinensis var. sinensis]|uniref:Uncharacterized protein n=1 Tax=Camellia sinensis var. sinensis TaxID=542762 RepID=A0A4V3WJY7_CAMSN|nr:hypothetical protein TEA_017838 [Camellia sinensis var. sinensis]
METTAWKESGQAPYEEGSLLWLTSSPPYYLERGHAKKRNCGNWKLLKESMQVNQKRMSPSIPPKQERRAIRIITYQNHPTEPSTAPKIAIKSPCTQRHYTRVQMLVCDLLDVDKKMFLVISSVSDAAE